MVWFISIGLISLLVVWNLTTLLLPKVSCKPWVSRVSNEDVELSKKLMTVQLPAVIRVLSKSLEPTLVKLGSWTILVHCGVVVVVEMEVVPIVVVDVLAVAVT